jgi:hypothetical protein
MQNADLTWAQDLGGVTELLSGEFFRWFGRSTSHQLWSSAMVVTPTVRGLFGLEWNAAENKLFVTPSLPAQWNDAKLLGVPIGQARAGIEIRRIGATLSIRLTGEGSKTIDLESHATGSKKEKGELRIPLPAAEVGIAHGLPEAGSLSSQMKVLDQEQSPRSLQLRLSAPANSIQSLFLRVNNPAIHLRMEGSEISPNADELRIQFPSGSGYVDKVVTLSW